MVIAKRAIGIIQALPPDKLEVATGILELLAESDSIESTKKLLDLIRFDLSCETEEITEEEANAIEEGLKDIEDGKYVKAEDLWRELGI